MLSADSELSRALAVRAIEGGLLRLKWLAAATRFELALLRHDRALKAGFKPDEPRVPRGNPDGGQWTTGGGQSNGDRGSTGSDKGPEIPKERPPKSSDRTAILKTVARRILQTGEIVATIAKLTAWLETYSPVIGSYNDPPKSLKDLQQSVSNPAPGYDIHHIVQRNQQSVFGKEAINSPENLVRIPRMKHWGINQWHETRNPEYGRQSPRQYLDGGNWDVQRAVGLDALEKAGLLKR